jgi:hypothetical protein
MQQYRSLCSSIAAYAAVSQLMQQYRSLCCDTNQFLYRMINNFGWGMYKVHPTEGNILLRIAGIPQLLLCTPYNMYFCIGCIDEDIPCKAFFLHALRGKNPYLQKISIINNASTARMKSYPRFLRKLS